MESQTFVMTTAVIALAGVDSHACGNSITPSDISTALMTPKRLLKIHPQTNAHTVEGSTQGSRESARSAPRPGNSWCMTKAQPSPSTMVPAVAATT